MEGSGGVTASVTLTTPVKANVWNHIAIEMTGSTNRVIRVWINGKYQGTATSSVSAITTGGSDLIIGRWQGSTQFSGQMDEIKITEELYLPQTARDFMLHPGTLPD